MLFLAVVAVTLLGATGYMVLERWDFADALYMTVITLSTVGYREVGPLSPGGQWFTVALIVGGWAVVAGVFAQVAQIIVQGEVRHLFEKRRVGRMVERMNRHFIVCGFGRMGERIAKELHERRIPFAVIEKDSDKCTVLRSMGIPVVEGDASDEKVLRGAHIESARGLATTVDTDAENVYVVLTARGIAKDLYIVARASDEKASEKLRRAGASRVITPYTIGGRHMAQTLIQPAAVEFFELASGRGDNMDIDIERITIPPDSPCAGKALSESGIRGETDIIIVAVQKKNASMQFNPSSATVIESGDTLIAMGNPRSIEKIGRLVGATEAGG